MTRRYQAPAHKMAKITAAQAVADAVAAADPGIVSVVGTKLETRGIELSYLTNKPVTVEPRTGQIEIHDVIPDIAVTADDDSGVDAPVLVGRLHPKLAEGCYRHIARATGIDRTHVSRVLRGQVGVSWKFATAIATTMGVSLQQLQSHIVAMRNAAALNPPTDRKWQTTRERRLVKRRGRPRKIAQE